MKTSPQPGLCLSTLVESKYVVETNELTRVLLACSFYAPHTLNTFSRVRCTSILSTSYGHRRQGIAMTTTPINTSLKWQHSEKTNKDWDELLVSPAVFFVIAQCIAEHALLKHWMYGQEGFHTMDLSKPLQLSYTGKQACTDLSRLVLPHATFSWVFSNKVVKWSKILPTNSNCSENYAPFVYEQDTTEKLWTYCRSNANW